MSWTGAFGRACGALLYRIVRGLALTRISPNVYTAIGLGISVFAAVLFGKASGENTARLFRYAGAVIFLAGFLDMIDGRIARATNQVTVFGAFFDSVIDRYSDVALFFGLLVYYARAGRFFYIGLVAFVMVSSVMVGFMERPERIVLIILGALFEKWNVMAPALWVLAVLSTITVIHRIYYTYQQ